MKYRVLDNPRPAPSTEDPRPRRLKLYLTQTTGAQELGTWPTLISRAERGLAQDRNVTDRYGAWLGK